MAKLTAAQRHKIKRSDFALPNQEKYPIQDKKHAANAKARASQMEKKGYISQSTEQKIDKKADKKLYGSSAEKKERNKPVDKSTQRKIDSHLKKAGMHGEKERMHNEKARSLIGSAASKETKPAKAEAPKKMGEKRRGRPPKSK